MRQSPALRAAARLPARDEQLQFEITALFALAVADIHGTDYEQQQAHALVYALSNGRVSQKQIATMASDLAQSSNPEIVSVSQMIAGGRKNLRHWANTLADSLPGGAAQSLVRGVQTGVLRAWLATDLAAPVFNRDAWFAVSAGLSRRDRRR